MALTFPNLSIRPPAAPLARRKLTLILPPELKREERGYRLKVALPVFLGGVATAATGTALLFTCGNRLLSSSQPIRGFDQQSSACEISSYSFLGVGATTTLTGALLFLAPNINRALATRDFLKRYGFTNFEVRAIWGSSNAGVELSGNF